MQLALLLPLLSLARGPDPDSLARVEVLSTVQKLFDGMRTRDTALILSVFEPGARLVGMRGPAGTERLQAISAARFAAFVARDKRDAWTERAWEPEVRIEGTLASVWARYDFHFGDQPSHCGIDAVHLLKTPEGWRITEIADTYQPADCPPRPVPSALPVPSASTMQGSLFHEMQASAEAWNRGDISGHVAIYADRAQMMGRNGPIPGKGAIQAALERGFWQAGKPLQALGFSELVATPLGPDHALLTGKFALSGGGKPDVSGRFSLVWELTREGWRVIHDHSS